MGEEVKRSTVQDVPFIATHMMKGSAPEQDPTPVRIEDDYVWLKGDWEVEGRVIHRRSSWQRLGWTFEELVWEVRSTGDMPAEIVRVKATEENRLDKLWFKSPDESPDEGSWEIRVRPGKLIIVSKTDGDIFGDVKIVERVGTRMTVRTPRPGEEIT